MDTQALKWRDPARWPEGEHWRHMLTVGREAGRFGFSIGDIRSVRKYRELVRCRAHVATLLHDQGLSTPQIGGLFYKDHSTIVTLLKRSAIRELEAAAT